MPRKTYHLIALEEKLFKRCERVVRSGHFGYSSTTEMVKDGTRRRLEDLEPQLNRFEERLLSEGETGLRPQPGTEERREAVTVPNE